MASTKEIKKELAIALKEIGKIEPWFDEGVGEWVFSHKLYPVEYGGATAKEVVKNYPLYLKEFLLHRLDNRLDPLVEKKTKGHGGSRPGAGRPKGTATESKIRIYLPTTIALWLKDQNNLNRVARLMQHHC